MLPAIVNQIQSRKTRQRAWRCIFLLDQYGYKDVPFESLRYIFRSLPKAEVILTFATDWLLDYITDSASCKLALNRLGLPLDPSYIGALKERAPAKWREFVQITLHEHLKTESGAKYYTPFFVHSEKANRDYWLVHLSTHARARDVMTSLHWDVGNHFRHYGQPGLDMLGYKATFDESYSEQPVLPSPTFDFSDIARARTLAALLEELPRRIAVLEKRRGAMTYEGIHANLCNLTPADSKLMREAAVVLLKEGAIDVKSPDGTTRRGRIMDGDLLSLARQTNIFHFPKDPPLSMVPLAAPLPLKEKSAQNPEPSPVQLDLIRVDEE